jgi:hypothetical protein
MVPPKFISIFYKKLFQALISGSLFTPGLEPILKRNPAPLYSAVGSI